MSAGAPEGLLYPWAIPLRARLRAEPEDFRVDEIAATEPEGEGEHVWLRIRKTGLNSETVAEWIARVAGVARSAVGYAGRKDRHAVTTQWFSVQLPGRAEPDWSEGPPAGVEVLTRRRHGRKLKTGHLAGNRFHLRLRDVRGDRAAADTLLERMRQRGLPHYFGEQRFGHANLERARMWLAGRSRPRNRNQRSLYLSAARAAIFNAVLRRRVEDGSWDQLLSGDVANLDGSGSIFPVATIDGTLRARCERLDLHPTGPLWGHGDPGTGGTVRALEAAAADAFGDLARGLEREQMRPGRRPLRMRPGRLAWSWESDETLVLEIELGPGGYATGVAGAVALTSAVD
ncbi:tRNA pseudouridine(13) synthase TruD [Thioalkalivibrio sp.]|uniref:tRNA pseudouridine(13) synthase TruD n=1 Tax=Thioalkalivibrio sp. TaxID=2093813 RepID=UPI0035618CEF